MNSTANDENFFKKVKIGMKYQNINSDIRKKQKNRFKSLFPNGKEMFMYLILKALNTYCLNVLPNIPLYYSDGSKLKNDLFNFIFDENYFYSLGFTPKPQSTPEQIYQPEPQMQSEQDIQPEQDVLLFFNGSEDEPEETIGSYEADLTASDEISLNTLPENLLRFFFDIHFERVGESVLFKCYHEYDNSQFLFTDLNFYNAALQKQPLDTFNYKMFAVNSDMLYFIDEIMVKAINRPLFKGIRFWTNNRRTLFHNYILNFNICGFFQMNQYRQCLVRFGKDFYKWNYNENDSFTIESLKSEQAELEAIHKIPQSNYMLPDYYNSQNKYCISVDFFYNKKTPKIDNDTIKTYLKYFTMNNTDVLDSLAIDFVNSVLTPTHLHKNTIIFGDYDKFDKWFNLFSPTRIAQQGIMKIFPNPVQTQEYNLLRTDKEEIKKVLKNYSKGINVLRSTHRYFLIKHDSNLSNSSKKLVNTIDFPYGGEYYTYKPLSIDDRLEIVKLLLVHGWHLLNEAPKSKPKIKQSPDEIFINNLINTNETRIPLNFLHQIYCHFVASGKTDTALHEELEAKGFVYDLQKIRKQDSEYLQILKKQCSEHFLDLKENKSDTQRVIFCKLDHNFWTEISLEKKQETEEKRSAEFDLYLKTLSEKYSKFFVKPNTYQPKSDPYKDFISPEKIPDIQLQ